MNAARVTARASLLLITLWAACSPTGRSTRQSTPPSAPAPSAPAPSAAMHDEAPSEAAPAVSTSASALTDLEAWLDSQDELRSFSRTELITGTWLVWLRHADHSTLCLDVAGETLRCWREAGQVTRVVPYAWIHRSQPEGFLAVYRERAQGVFWSIRMRPELERAHARSQLFLSRARPSWWPSPHRTAPLGIISTPRRRAVPLTEAPELGPLRWLAVKSLHMRGQGRVAERQDSIVVARAGERSVLCVHQAAWTCSPVRSAADANSEYLEGFDLDGTSVALVRSVRSEDAAGSGSASAHLEFWERREILEYRGGVQVGRAIWRPDEDATRRGERVLHSVHVESDLCLRIDEAETAQGQTAIDFSAVGEQGALNLARAPQNIELSTTQGSDIADLGGLWRLEANGLRRVRDCAPEPRTRLSQVEIPTDLEPHAAACLAHLNEAIDELPSMGIVEGKVCGATHFRDGITVARERFRYEGERRVESVRVERLRSDEDRYVYHEHFLWRAARRVGEDYESVHFRDGEEECRHTHTRRDTLDAHGRPTRTRLRVRPCEGDARRVNERRQWRSGDGFDVGEYDSDQNYFVPSYAAPVAAVTCSETRCSCQVDARDESGRVRVRLHSGSRTDVEFLYDCPPMTWPRNTEDLRQLSIETSFEATPAGD
ncbi:MAG: hypothetical protein AB8H86_32445 [Polyangiales bacterium]